MERIKVYLASPYGGNGGPIARSLCGWRFRNVTKVTAYWMKRGLNIFSPITHSHPIGKYVKFSHEEWLDFDFQWIDACDVLWVYCQFGWQKSDGVRQEVAYAKRKGMPVKYLKKGGKTFHNYSENEWF